MLCDGRLLSAVGRVVMSCAGACNVCGWSSYCVVLQFVADDSLQPSRWLSTATVAYVIIDVAAVSAACRVLW